MTIRCPHCGSPVMIRGSRWECGYCGDFGSISSLHPSEKAKLMRAAAPSVQVTITVTGSSDEPTESDEEISPHHFSLIELEDMVRRWDFSENEWACRDLLITAFPEAVRFWTTEELFEMDTMELLGKVGEWKPEVGIQMMKFLLDTAEPHLQDPEAAEQLLGNDLYELCKNQAVQTKLLERLKQDERFAVQLFQSAYAGDLQEGLLEACDWFGESALKVRLRTLLAQNPYFEELE